MRAWEVLQDAYQAQMEGDYDRAVELYQSSLELHPTAEAHTFLGWTYHFQGSSTTPSRNAAAPSISIRNLAIPTMTLART